MNNKPEQLLNESISSMIEEIESAPYRAGPYGARVLSALRGLQERRKADGAEPVFFIEVEGDDWIQAGRIPGSTFDFNNLPGGINKLYAAPQPAPVVADIDTIALNTARNIMCDINRMEGWPGGDVQLLACIQSRIEQDYRAAMLQAGNSSVIPDGYVLVPKVVTAEIGNAINEIGRRCTCGNCSQRLWDLLLAAAPQQEVK